MSKLFISHSSTDKAFCVQLCEDLSRMGHTPWLDTYEIKVGEDIVEGIEMGISDADFVVLVLSPDSVSSNWVKKEWHAKFWTEINEGKIALLPALLKDCEVPLMLRAKKYADFRESYAVGFVELLAAVPVMATSKPNINGLAHDQRLAELIEICQSRELPLAQCLTRALTYATEKGDQCLLEFCRLEVSGYRHLDQFGQRDVDRLQIQHRVIELFVSPFAQINLQAAQWGQNASTLIDYLRRSDDFYPCKMFMPEPIGELEAQISKLGTNGILTITAPMKSFMPDTEYPDLPVSGYAHPNNVMGILNGTRSRVTSMLMEHLPGELNPNKSMHLTGASHPAEDDRPHCPVI